jgi:hypothetical protein
MFIKNLVGFIFHKFVRNFTHICEKILQICVKLGKLCLVGLGPDLYFNNLHFGRKVFGPKTWADFCRTNLSKLLTHRGGQIYVVIPIWSNFCSTTLNELSSNHYRQNNLKIIV